LKFANDLKHEINEALAKKGIVMDVRIGVADRMIENWFLADADALDNHLEIPTETDSISGKSWIKK
jgi:4-alpha-glucanotransferase